MLKIQIQIEEAPSPIKRFHGWKNQHWDNKSKSDSNLPFERDRTQFDNPPREFTPRQNIVPRYGPKKHLFKGLTHQINLKF